MSFEVRLESETSRMELLLSPGVARGFSEDFLSLGLNVLFLAVGILNRSFIRTFLGVREHLRPVELHVVEPQPRLDPPSSAWGHLGD